jgi:hypothetical protein
MRRRSFDIDDARAWIVRRLKRIKNLSVKAPLAGPYRNLQRENRRSMSSAANFRETKFWRR